VQKQTEKGATSTLARECSCIVIVVIVIVVIVIVVIIVIIVIVIVIVNVVIAACVDRASHWPFVVNNADNEADASIW
jgi:hypothetical protein